MENYIFICLKQMKQGDYCRFSVLVAADLFEAEEKMLREGRPENWTIEPITPDQARQLIKELRKSLDKLE